jgi:hypothetical protein
MGTRGNQSKNQRQNNQNVVTSESTRKTWFIFPSFKDIIRSLLSSLIAKIIIGLLVLLGLGNWINNMVENPKELLNVKVTAHDESDAPLFGAEISFINKKVKGYTNSNGVFEGQVPVRRKDESIIINCKLDRYEIQSKTKDIPINKKTRLETIFRLELNGYYKKYVHGAEESLSAGF